MDQAEQPAGRLLHQVMSDVEELIGRHDWGTALWWHMAYLLGEEIVPVAARHSPPDKSATT